MYISFKKSDVTPNRPCYLGGYERISKSLGKLDDILINTCVMKYGEQILTFSIIDCICLSESFVQEVQKAISDLFMIPQTNINVACIHTHSAPLFFPLPTLPSEYEEEYESLLFKTIIRDVEYCLNSLAEASMEMFCQEIEGCYGNRNTQDGEADKNFTIIEFKQDGNVIGLLVHMACHPTILGRDNLFMSSDLLGNVRLKLTEKFQVPVVLFNGACGDVSTRFYREYQGSNEVNLVADKIISQLTFENKITIPSETVCVADVSISSCFNVTNDLWTISELKRIKSVMKNPEKAMKVKNLYHRLDVKMQKGVFDLILHCRIYLIGSLIIVTIPGEVVSFYSHYLKNKYPNHLVLLFSYCNGYVSYLINEEDYGKYFESYVAITPKGTLEKLSYAIEMKIDEMIK